MRLLLALLYLVLMGLPIGEELSYLFDDPSYLQLVVDSEIMSLLFVAAFLMSLVRALQRPGVWFNHEIGLLIAFLLSLLLPIAFRGWIGGVWYKGIELVSSFGIMLLIPASVEKEQHLRIYQVALFLLMTVPFIHGANAYRLGNFENPYVIWQHATSESYLESLELQAEALAELPKVYRIRAMGMLSDPNDFSQFALSVLPLLFSGINFKRRKIWTLLLISVPVGILLLTKSRGAIVGLMVLAGILLWKKKKSKPLLVCYLLAALLIANIAGRFTGRDLNVSQGSDRLSYWSDGLGALKEAPIWGTGYGTFPEITGRHTAHNSFLLTMVELGAVGFLMLWGMIVACLYRCQRSIRLLKASDLPDAPQLVQWGECLTYSLTAFLVTAFFLSRNICWVLFTVLGLMVAFNNLAYERLGVTQGVQSPVGQREQSAGLTEPIPWFRWTMASGGGILVLIWLMVRSRAFGL